MKLIRNNIMIGVISALLLASCGKQEPNNTSTIRRNTEEIPVEIITLAKAEVNRSIFTSGQFTTDDETWLSFKTGGIINKVYVKEGDRIKKGQLLAALDLTEISSQVNQAQLTFNKTKRDFLRAENLFRDSVISLEQLQNARTSLDIAQQQLQSAKFNLLYSEIRTSNDGVILEKKANEGQVISPGMPVLKTSNKGDTDWILRVAVSDMEWAQIKINDKAKVQIEALKFNNLDGYVNSKTESADNITGSFSVDIKLKNTRKLNIASGMFGKAEIKLSESRKVWQIPYESLLDGNANQGYVFVTNDNKHAVKVPVRIETLNKNEAIISEGLSEYISLIVSGSAYLRDKSPIVVINSYKSNE